MSCFGKRTRLANLLVTKQTANEYEQPAVAKNWRLDSGFEVQATPEMIARDILKSSFTPEPDIAGIKVGVITGTSEIYGADYTNGTNKPWFNDAFNSIQLVETAVKAIPVSAIATQFVYGEIVSGATGVGRVVVPTQAGDTKIYIQETTAGFTAETITGSIAGSATATGASTAAGWSYKYDTDSCARLSVQSENDGLISQMYNCVPTVTITSDAGNIPKLNYEISGVIRDIDGEAQWMRDGSMTDLTGLRSSVVPPRFVNARFKMDSYVPIVDSTLTIDTGVTKALRTDANNASGAEGYILTARKSLMTFRINTPTNAELDIYANWFSVSPVGIEFRFGKDVGNTFWVYAPSAKYQNVTPADQDGELKHELQFSLSGDDDAEIEIICI
jgi:hypothetical protein